MMAKDFVSHTECAGGCGNLLMQSAVDRGVRYLWGHKQGCPPDGQSARRKPSAKADAAPAKDMSYVRALVLLETDLKLVEQQIADADRRRAEAGQAVARESALLDHLRDRKTKIEAAWQSFRALAGNGEVEVQR